MHFAESHAMDDYRVALFENRWLEFEVPVFEGVLSEPKKVRVAGLSVGPEDSLDVAGVPTGSDLFSRAGEIIFLKSFGDSDIAGHLIHRLH